VAVILSEVAGETKAFVHKNWQVSEQENYFQIICFKVYLSYSNLDVLIYIMALAL